jgi:iron complex outermembrane receptor protein
MLAGLYLAAGTNLVFDQALLPDTPATFRQTYALFNALVGYSRTLAPHLRASAELYGKNLTNRDYRPSQSTRSRPQEVGIALTVKY